MNVNERRLGTATRLGIGASIVLGSLAAGVTAQAGDEQSHPPAPKPFAFAPDLVKLLQHGSDGYQVGARRVKRTRDLAVLTRLSASEDESIRAMARLMVELERFARAQNARVGGLAGPRVEPIRREMNRILRGSALRDLVDRRHRARWTLDQMVGKKGLATQVLDSQALGLLGVATDHVMREETSLWLRRHLARTAADLPLLPAQKFPRTLRRVKNLAMFGVRNGTGKTLHDCILILDYRPNRKIVARSTAESLARFERQARPFPGMRHALDAQRRLLAAHAVRQSVDKCTIVYVDRWRPSTRLDLALEDVPAVAMGSKSGALTIWTRAGRLEEVSLPMADYRARMRREHQRMLANRKRAAEAAGRRRRRR